MSTVIVPPLFDVSELIEIAPELAPSPPKKSLSRTLIELFVESSFKVTASATEVGTSFTEVILTVTVAVDVSPSESVIVYVKESEPLKSASGV